MLDTIVYEVEYLNGQKASISVNTIAKNILSQVDKGVNRFMIFYEILDHRVDGTETMHQDDFIISKRGGKRQKDTTKGWEILIQWKDGSTTWESMK